MFPMAPKMQSVLFGCFFCVFFFVVFCFVFNKYSNLLTVSLLSFHPSRNNLGLGRKLLQHLCKYRYSPVLIKDEMRRENNTCILEGPGSFVISSWVPERTCDAPILEIRKKNSVFEFLVLFSIPSLYKNQ